MWKIVLAWSFLFLLLVTSCQPGKKKETTISGSFTDGAGLKLILQEMDIREIRSVDSVTLGDGGTFRFTPAINEPGFWLIKVPSGKILVLLIHPGDKVELSGSMNDFPNHVDLSGPRDALLLHEFFRFTRKNEASVDSLEMILSDNQDSETYFQYTQQVDSAFRKIWEQQRSYEMNFIDRHPGSLASLIVVNYAFGLSSVLDPTEDKPYFLKIDSALVKSFPGNKHVKYHHQRVMELDRK